MAGPWRASELMERLTDDYKTLHEIADFWDSVESGAISAAVGAVLAGSDQTIGPNLVRALARLRSGAEQAEAGAHQAYDLLEDVVRILRAREFVPGFTA